MKSFESRQPYNPVEQDEKPGLLEFSLEAEAGSTEQDFSGTRLSLAEMLIRNPAFKSEKAHRALDKLKEAWNAAEENLPEELKNELRHEHRDASTSDPVHIGSIVADAPSRQPGLASMLSQDPDEETAEEEAKTEAGLTSDSVSIYRKAMIRGFATALVLVMLFMLFLVMR
jgi:hypothetical protein